MRFIAGILLSFGLVLIAAVLMGTVAAGNQAPTVELTSPDNGENETNTVTLEWTGDDPDEDVLHYDVYLDTEETADTMIAENLTDEFFNLDTMFANVTYFWKVVARDDENETTSEIWNFTLENSPPYVILFYPFDEEDLEETYVTLTWIGSDVDDDPVTYDIYLDTDPDPTTLVDSITEDIYHHPEPLQKGETYYWKIIAKDWNSSTESDVDSFTISNHADVVDGEINDEGEYRSTRSRIDPGGNAFPFRMKMNDTLNVDISVIKTLSGFQYTVDFYLVKSVNVRQWYWGEENDTIDTISIGTKENSTSIKYTFTAAEDDVYCIIIDDSEMGQAPPSSEQNYRFNEHLEIVYTVILTSGGGVVEDEPEEEESSDVDSLALITCCGGFIAIIIIGYVLYNRFSGSDTPTYAPPPMGPPMYPPGPGQPYQGPGIPPRPGMPPPPGPPGQQQYGPPGQGPAYGPPVQPYGPPSPPGQTPIVSPPPSDLPSQPPPRDQFGKKNPPGPGDHDY